MKTMRFALLLFFVTALVSTLSSCKGKDDPAPTAASKITDLLDAGTWQIQAVSVDGVAHTDLFTNMKLTFTATGFTTVNGGPVWPSNGTWTFTDKDATAFTRSDGIVVTINQIDNSNLILSLTWTKTTLGGRVNSIS